MSSALKNPLVIATREFLLRRKEEMKNAIQINSGSDDDNGGSIVDSFDVVISLSGGTYCNTVHIHTSNMTYSTHQVTSHISSSIYITRITHFHCLYIGVDSMVIFFILHLLRPIVHIGRIIAIHIDYGNRQESSQEAEFVKSYSEQYGGICHIRTITEVTRGITDRSDYEKISRNIRYGFYKQILETELNLCFDDLKHASTLHGSGIIFGHHLGDVQENVLSNIMRYVVQVIWCKLYFAIHFCSVCVMHTIYISTYIYIFSNIYVPLRV